MDIRERPRSVGVRRVLIVVMTVTICVVLGALFLISRARVESALPPDLSPGETASHPPVSTSSPPSPAASEKPFSVVTVFYATDRKQTTAANLESRYGSERVPNLAYGRAAVSIPRDHRMGRIESPSWLHFEIRPDPTKHVILRELSPIQGEPQFMRSISQELEERQRREIVVFVHGFNVDFGGAVKRTAQIVYDLGFDGIPIAYTWASEAKLSPTAYVRDGNASDVTVPKFRKFLVALAKNSGASRIHVIAHSMGNKVLARALEGIATDPQVDPKPQFGQLMLTAPDIDEEVMLDLAERFSALAQRVTLYASQNDIALVAAHKYANSRRAGEGGAAILIMPRVDSIEASAVDTNLVGHFYYGDNRSVLSDMFYLLRTDFPPDRRFGMRPYTSERGTYWAFVP